MNLSYVLFLLSFSSSIAMQVNTTNDLSTLSTWADTIDHGPVNDDLNDEIHEDHFESYMNYPRAHDKMTNTKTDFKTKLLEDLNTTYTDFVKDHLESERREDVLQQEQNNPMEDLKEWADNDTKVNEHGFSHHKTEPVNDDLNEEFHEEHFEYYMNYPHTHDKMTNTKTDYKEQLREDINTTYTDFKEHLESERREDVLEEEQNNSMEDLKEWANAETETGKLEIENNDVDEDQLEADFESILEDGIEIEYPNSGEDILTSIGSGENGGRRKMLRGK